MRPGEVVFAEVGQDLIIRLDRDTGVTNHIAVIDFSGSTGGIAIGGNGDIYAMRPKVGSSVAEFFRIDGQTAAITQISAQTLITSGRRMKVSPDGRSLVVAGETQSGGRGVFRVDLATGQQSVITTNLTDTPDFERPWDIAFSPQGHIYVTEFNTTKLLRFNADGTGRQIFSSGGLFQTIGGVDVGPDGSIYVVDRFYHGVIRVDPVTGVQSHVTTNGLVINPSDIGVDLDGNLLVADAVVDVVVRVNSATGQQTLLHSGTPGPRSPCAFIPRASLAAQPLPNHELLLKWPDQEDFWKLQFTSTLAISNSWADSSLVPTLNGTNREVYAPSDLNALFFRLRKR